LGEYHVPVNADIPSLQAFFVEEQDEHVNPIGAKGIGEVSYVGIAAAVANTLDKLMWGLSAALCGSLRSLR
jgi:xanthine dehydrogenase YagR molybdenum-binding subunit